MTGSEVMDALVAAIQPLRDDIRRLEESLNGNGHPGLKGRVTSLETGVKVLMWIVGMGSPIFLAVGCAIGPKLMALLGVK